MSSKFFEHQLLVIAAQNRLLTAIAKSLAAQKLPKDLAAQLHEDCENLLNIQPPDLSPKRREPGDSPQSWESRRESGKLFFFEWAGEEPQRVTYEAAAKILGYAPHTLRVRISSSASKSFALWKSGKWQVLARTREGLEPALDAKFLVTKNPDDRRMLPKRPRAK